MRVVGDGEVIIKNYYCEFLQVPIPKLIVSYYANIIHKSNVLLVKTYRLLETI